MTEINLLPWRATLRNRAKKEFLIVFGMLVVLSIFIVTLNIHILQSKIQRLQSENAVLKNKVDLLESKIATVKTTRIKINDLAIKRAFLEQLQSERMVTVRLLEQVAYQTPPGVYLTRFDKKGLQLTFEGVAASNISVSEFMRKIGGAPWIAEPQLTEIKAIDSKEDGKGYLFKIRARCVIAN